MFAGGRVPLQDVYGGRRNVKMFGQQLDNLLVGRALDRGSGDFDPKLVRSGLLDQGFARPGLNLNPNLSVCSYIHRDGRISVKLRRGLQELQGIQGQRFDYKSIQEEDDKKCDDGADIQTSVPIGRNKTPDTAENRLSQMIQDDFELVERGDGEITENNPKHKDPDIQHQYEVQDLG